MPAIDFNTLSWAVPEEPGGRRANQVRSKHHRGVILAKAGVQEQCRTQGLKHLDSGFHRNDKDVPHVYFENSGQVSLEIGVLSVSSEV